MSRQEAKKPARRVLGLRGLEEGFLVGAIPVPISEAVPERNFQAVPVGLTAIGRDDPEMPVWQGERQGVAENVSYAGIAPIESIYEIVRKPLIQPPRVARPDPLEGRIGGKEGRKRALILREGLRWRSDGGDPRPPARLSP